ncbi:MAG: AAA-like domain-containing protein [Proteobacteria bacterium]|nr:AAA-like domain-containing protein [Pseudomonadota bacterium]
MKRFNITGTCFPKRHYMVDISGRVSQIKKMVDNGDYFCINRGRQYGKTTTLNALKNAFKDDFCVLSISFEKLSDEAFASLEGIRYNFAGLLSEIAEYNLASWLTDEMKELIQKQLVDISEEKASLVFFQFISKLNALASKPIILMIDEVDQACNHPAFIKFLGILRDKYLNREQVPTFQSVILAGVYDIKNLKLKIRPEAEHTYNSPWNIATSFDVEMAFDVQDVEGMLNDYEHDHHTGMDIHAIAQSIIDYTSGYPFLVSKLCKTIDESELAWTHEGIVGAVKALLNERNTLFDDMNKKLDDFPNLRDMLKDILYRGEPYKYNVDDKSIELARMFNFITDEHGLVKISNRIFESRLYNAFAFEEESNLQLVRESYIEKNQFIENGELDIEKIIQRFIVHYHDIYGDKDVKFHESEGRKYFMFYVKPIINGVGNYYIEAQTRDQLRTDMIIDYLGKQYVIEMKIWRGESYNKRGEQQLLEYLDYYHLNKGYLVSFCFNKNKQIGVKTVRVGDREIVEGVV